MFGEELSRQKIPPPALSIDEFPDMVLFVIAGEELFQQKIPPPQLNAEFPEMILLLISGNDSSQKIPPPSPPLLAEIMLLEIWVEELPQ
jgi:hypothetical protein